MKKYTYISSKMSGLPNYNFGGFKRKQIELNEKGYNVWNPAEHEITGDNVMWSEIMAQDIVDIETNCDTVYMFGKWYRSQGACVEMLSAHRLGLRIEFEQKWLGMAVNAILSILFKNRKNK